MKQKKVAVLYDRVRYQKGMDQHWRTLVVDKYSGEYEFLPDRYVDYNQLQKRYALQRLMEDARAGKFQAVFVRDLSRFSRDTIQALEYVEELEKLGIDVVDYKNDMHVSDVKHCLKLINALMG